MKTNTIDIEHLKSLESKDSSDKLNFYMIMRLQEQREMIQILNEPDEEYWEMTER